MHLNVQTPPTEHNIAAMGSDQIVKMRELASELHHIDTLRVSKLKRSTSTERNLLDGAKQDSLNDNEAKHHDT